MEDLLQYDSLIYSIASKYKNVFEIDDLLQVGRIGLIKAYNNFDSSFNTKFSTYAYNYIHGEILNYIRNSRILKVSRDMQSLHKKIIIAKDKLTSVLGKVPSNTEIALFLEVDEKLVDDAIISSELVKSLDYSLNSNEEDKDLSLYDVKGFEENGYNPIILDLRSEIKELDDSEKRLIYYRYFEDMSQKEVGDILNTSQVSVSRSEAKILKKLKDKLAA